MVTPRRSPRKVHGYRLKSRVKSVEGSVASLQLPRKSGGGGMELVWLACGWRRHCC